MLSGADCVVPVAGALQSETSLVDSSEGIATISIAEQSTLQFEESNLVLAGSNTSFASSVGSSFANPDALTVYPELTLLDNTIDVLANDNSSSLLRVSSVTQPANGTVAVTEPGTVSYTPNDNNFDVDSFTYSVDVVDQKFDPINQTRRDNFGGAVAISGDHAIVGARLAEGGAANSGQAYIYRRFGVEWRQVATLAAPNAGAADYFGFSVAIDGGNAVVGALLSDADGGVNAGAAYVFSRNEGGANSWGLTKQLDNPFAANVDQFGYSVAIDGNTIAIGSRLDDDPSRAGSNHGSVSIFDRNLGGAAHWGHRTTFYADSPVGAGDRFGSSLALENDTVVVGTPGFGGGNSGAVFVHQRHAGGNNTWGIVKQLEGSDPQTGDRFGTKVSLSNGVLAVGNPFDDQADPSTGTIARNSGSVFLFSQNEGGVNNFGQVAQFQSDGALDSRDGQRSDQFGSDISISGNTLVVGASGTSGQFGATGLIYVYQNDSVNGWQFERTIASPTPRVGERLGTALALDQGGLLIGSRLDPANLFESQESVRFVNLAGDLSTATVTVTVRDIPADLVVDSLDDTPFDGDFSAGNLTLREAIEIANLRTGHDIITFDQIDGIFADATEDVLTLSGDELRITDDLTLVGPATASLTLDGDSSLGILEIIQADATIDGLIFNNGVARAANPNSFSLGGAISASGNLTVSNSIFNNSSAGVGGAIRHIGDLTITNSVFSNNRSTVGGSAVDTQNGQVTIADSVFSNNQGRAISANNVDLTITNSDFNSNFNGGVSVSASANVTITNSTFLDNRGTNGGGAEISGVDNITIENSLFQGNATINRSSEQNDGGALKVGSFDQLLIENSRFLNNTSAKAGGAISITEGSNRANETTIRNSTISGNISGTSRFPRFANRNGGGIRAEGLLVIENSTISNNRVAVDQVGGGGLAFFGSSLDITNTTISNNQATSGSGLSIFSAKPENQHLILNSTIVGEGDGIQLILVGDPDETLEIHNSIIATGIEIPSGFQLDSDSSNNLVFDPLSTSLLVDGVKGNLVGDGMGNGLTLSSVLAPLADNGGLTETHALVAGSRAINAGNNSKGAGLLTDQRGVGFARSLGNRIDIGALESGN